jgi:polyphosphate kinase
MLESRFDVVTAEQLEALTARALPRGVTGAPDRVLYRDLYIDTADELLHRRGISCRLRVGSDDLRQLTVFIGTPDDVSPPRRFEAKTESSDPRVVLAGNSEPARRLKAVVDARLLQTVLELEIERAIRVADRTIIGLPRVHVFYDRIHVRTATSSRAFHQVTVRSSSGSVGYQAICHDLEEDAGLRPISAGTRERAQLLLKWMEREESGRAAQSDSAVVLVLASGDRLAIADREGRLFLPVEQGSGIGVARALLERSSPDCTTDVRLVGKMSAVGPYPSIEVWSADLNGSGANLVDLQWAATSDVLSRATALDVNALGAIAVALRSPSHSPAPAIARLSIDGRKLQDAAISTAEPHILNAEASILAFIARVLELAEDRRVPLGERMRYLAIVSSNLDEFFMVRVAGIKRSALEQSEERGADGLTAAQQLDLVALHARSLIARQYRCYAACVAEAAGHGLHIAAWSSLNAAQRIELRDVVREMIPSLTPLAMTLSPGHPFPRLRHLCLSLAVVFVDRPGSTPHFAQVELPDDFPRFIPVPGTQSVIAAEELVRANVDLLYPSSVVEQAYAFRVTRGTDLDLDEKRAESLIHSVEAATRQRFDQPVVRVEVERAMPAVLRDVVMRELRRESGGSMLEPRDLFEIDGPLDLRCLGDLELNRDARLWFPKVTRAEPLASYESIWDAIDERDRLLHHPYDDYKASVVRFFKEAARDPQVTAIKLTIYRADEGSPIMGALVEAAEAGKDVIVFVELKARFDEERNVGWARRMEAAGGRVVHGLVGVKTHAKVALVVRKHGHGHKRYVHAGTGNYNSQTGKLYTDLSLFTANEDITADVQDLFNELTGRSRPADRLSRGCLISPKQLLPELISKIEREAAHARAGRPAWIRMKINGLSDTDVVNALVRASQDGVQVDLIVRGVCTLRPQVPGLTNRIRIVSVLGRFLEHSRIFFFQNGGAPEYYIGSADMRPRNLRRRVELLVPVKTQDNRRQLASILDTYFGDATAWELGFDGEYVRRGGSESAQSALIELLARSKEKASHGHV